MVQSLCRIVSLVGSAKLLLLDLRNCRVHAFWGVFPDYWWSVRQLSVLCAITWLTQSHCDCILARPCAAPLALQSVPQRGELSMSYSTLLCPCPCPPCPLLQVKSCFSSQQPSGWLHLSWQGLPGCSRGFAGGLCSLALVSAVQVSFGAGRTGFFQRSISTWFPLSVLLKSPSRAAAEASALRPVVF